MTQQKQVRLIVNRQKGKEAQEIFLPDSRCYEEDGVKANFNEYKSDGCRVGRLYLNIKNSPITDNANLSMETPVRIFVPQTELPLKITALYLFCSWWTRPAFVEKLSEIPQRTQVSLFKYKDRYACLVPEVGSVFKTYLAPGTDTELCFEMTAGTGGQSIVDEPVYVCAEDATIYGAVKKAFDYLAKAHGVPRREERNFSEMFGYLGWCSWDAFYRDISEDKVRQKAKELLDKKVPVKWMLFDDGWLNVEGERLLYFEPDYEKFPNGFKNLTDDLKRENGINWFGVWHALCGYWDGIEAESEVALKEGGSLCNTANGRTVPSPNTGKNFYDDWYKILAKQGIDFLKVDTQSSLPYFFDNTMSICEAARGIHAAVEDGALRMGGAVINCMGMAMENILSRPYTAVSRNSDDFFPKKDNSFAEHLLENAYNSLYHNELYYCDWDMFWTKHKDAEKHALLRAISGGPVYFSDPVGDTIPEVLKPLSFLDGKLLTPERSAKPTSDCIFSDPFKTGVLKLQNTAPWAWGVKGGGIASYNLTKEPQTFAFYPKDIIGIDMSEKYWIYDFFNKKAALVDIDEQYTGILEAGGYAWHIVLPHTGRCAFLGLTEKYLGFTAIESAATQDNCDTYILYETGRTGFVSLQTPKKAFANGIDVTAKMLQNGNLYTLNLPEAPVKTAVTVFW